MKTVDMIEVCNICKSEVKWLAPDSISYCPMCEVVVEGNTELVEARYMRCPHCNTIKPIDKNAAFFTEMPKNGYDSFYCGCRGWD